MRATNNNQKKQTLIAKTKKYLRKKEKPIKMKKNKRKVKMQTNRIVVVQR